MNYSVKFIKVSHASSMTNKNITSKGMTGVCIGSKIASQ